MTKIRLSKYLADHGIASRRASEELIFNGHVTVNGKKVLSQVLVGKDDEICVNGELVEKGPPKVYFILNKPKGFVCGHEVKYKPKRVIDLFDPKEGRLITVGRLDKDTTGLLLVTNDGHFAQRVIHPSADIQKEYVAKVDWDVHADQLKDISKGCFVDGTYVKPLKVIKVRRGTVKVVVGEGKKREVRRLLEHAGLVVIELKRTRIGGLHLGGLELGRYRAVTVNEMESIFTGENS